MGLSPFHSSPFFEYVLLLILVQRVSRTSQSDPTADGTKMHTARSPLSDLPLQLPKKRHVLLPTPACPQ